MIVLSLLTDKLDIGKVLRADDHLVLVVLQRLRLGHLLGVVECAVIIIVVVIIVLLERRARSMGLSCGQ